LQECYQQAELVVPFFSKHYAKPWCALEWETIRGILLTRRADDAVIPVHLDDTAIPGWPAVGFGIKPKGRTAEQIAGL
ncbi:MAG: toll/interleukin-1 receptor domain-containing protein, partial [Lamprocystis purpurea]|nr:toll/interleukin-1 receptor domain-containing protein [Lamprocystis purpurea]